MQGSLRLCSPWLHPHRERTAARLLVLAVEHRRAGFLRLPRSRLHLGLIAIAIRLQTPTPPSFQSASASGDEDSARGGSRDSPICNARDARAVFPPEQVAEVRAIARELPALHGLPLGRFTRTELHRLLVERGVTDASATICSWRSTSIGAGASPALGFTRSSAPSARSIPGASNEERSSRVRR